MHLKSLGFAMTLAVLPLGCSDDQPTSDDDGTGDGDATGDGDGDGDGDATGDGDGDGDATGDGDGDATGDGDGDDTPSLPPDFLDELTEVGGCSDVYIGVNNPDATMALTFSGAELAATAHMLGETQVRESILPSEDVLLRIALGTNLDQGCNDALIEDPVVDHEWTAVSGTVTLTVVPTGEAQPWQVPADATLELTNVTFEADGLESVVIDSWTVADVSVGWFPG